MTPDAREQARHISEVTKAFAEGKEIQISPKGDEEWVDCENPTWRFVRFDYRVKLEERKPREWQMWVNASGVRFEEFAEDRTSVENWTKITVREVLPSDNTGEI